jgi:hypothetical protein
MSKEASRANDLRVNADDSLVYPSSSDDIKEPFVKNFGERDTEAVSSPDIVFPK